MKWNIIGDSACDLFAIDDLGENERFATVPMKIQVGEKEFVDDEFLDVPEMMKEMREYEGRTGSACPSPNDWANEFMKADMTIAITITSKMSGSYNSAMTAKSIVEETNPEKKIYIVDSKSAGAGIAIIMYKIHELIKQYNDFDKITEKIEKLVEDTNLLFVLSSFNNLIKNGRMNPIVGGIASKLRIKILGCASEKGELSIVSKVRGEGKIVASIVSQMKERKYNGSKVMIAHCGNLTLAKQLKEDLLLKWENAKVCIRETRGLCSYYAEERGIMVGF